MSDLIIVPKLSEHLSQLASDKWSDSQSESLAEWSEFNRGSSDAYFDASKLAKAYETTGQLNAPHSVTELPTDTAQYLFLRPDGDLELWRLTAHGWFDASGTHYESPLERNPGLTQWGRARL